MTPETGDAVVAETTEPAQTRRIGTIVGLRNAGGSPPCLVNWLVGDLDSLGRQAPGRDRDQVTRRSHEGAGRR
jgi:hypothetical protein